MEKPAPKPEINLKKRKIRRWLIGSFSVLILLALSLTVYAFAYSKKIAPHVEVSGVPVGGLTESTALTRLQNAQKDFAAHDMTVAYGGKKWLIKPVNLKLQYADKDAVDQAYDYGKVGSFPKQIRNILAALVHHHQVVDQTLPLGDPAKKYLGDTVLKEVEQPTSETVLSFSPGNVSIQAGKAGQLLDYGQFTQDLTQAFSQDEHAISLHLDSFQPKVASEKAESAKELATYLLADTTAIQSGTTTVQLAPADLAPLLTSVPKEDGSGLTLQANSDALGAKIDQWKATFEHKSANATLKVDSNGQAQIDQPGQDGTALDKDATIKAFNTYLATATTATPRVFQPIVNVEHADVSADTLSSLGIKELIGTATTDFVGSPSNRVFNITRGQQTLNGRLVKNGDEFSTIGALGPIDESTGYLPELVILNNRTVPEAGGGLCQVSTTLFRAVLNAGLPVTERTNHSYRVSYYEAGVGPGLDATVYDPEPDFKWKNDTGQAVYVQAHVDGTKITFDLYGTKDGRSSNISAPTITDITPPGDPIMLPTDTMYKDETKQVETPHSGATTVVTYTVTRNGQTINQQVFHSLYKPWPAQYLVGTKDRPS